MTVESALQMRDMHFAESVLTLLLEIANAIEPDLSTRARLLSQQARIMIDRKQFSEAAAALHKILKALESSSYKRSSGAAYCWLALAHAFAHLKKEGESQTAHRMAQSMAQESFGAQDPQLMLFKQPLPQ